MKKLLFFLVAAFLVATCAWAQSFTDFESFTLNATVHYEGNGSTITYPSSPAGYNYTVPDPYGSLWTVSDEWGQSASPFDEEVEDDGTGNNVWRVSNAVTTGGFSNLPNSPTCPLAAGESTSFLYNDRGLNHTSPLSPPNGRSAAATKYFSAGFKFKSATGAAQPDLFVSISPGPKQSAYRMSYIGIEDVGTGFDLLFYETSPGQSFDLTTIATNLSYTDWHEVEIFIEFVDGLNGLIGNDIVTLKVNGTEVHTGTTWETYVAEVASATSPSPIAVDALIFRLSGSAIAGNLGNGLFFDDITIDNMLANPPVRVYSDGTETTLLSGHLTIQEGINAAVAGNVVRVDAGTYPENLTINKSIELRGAQYGVDARGRSASESIITTSTSNKVILITGSNVVVDGFEIVGAGSAEGMINIDGGNSSIIRNNIISGTAGGWPGAAFSITASSSNVEISQNEMDGSGANYIIALDGNDNHSGLDINDNNFFDGEIFAGDKNFVSSGVTISGNLFDGAYCNLSSAFEGSIISGNTFQNNLYNNFQAGLKNSTISGNIFHNTGPSPYAGVPSSCMQVYGTEFGLTPSENVSIDDNTFYFNGVSAPDEFANGVRLRDGVDAAEVTLYHNKFLNGTAQTGAKAIYFSGTVANTLDAEYNYWSTLVETEIGALMDGSVDYTPWCNSDFSICYAGDGPITTISALTEQCYDATFTIPVTVTDFVGVGSIALVMDFDQTNLNVPTLTPHGNLSGGTLYMLNPATGKLVFSWINAVGVNIPDGEALFTLEFSYSGASCPGTLNMPLTWDASDPIYCEYATPEGNIFIDEPFNTFYIAGGIEIKDETDPVITSCPPNATVEVNANSNPSALGFATATDNCGTVDVTFADTWAAGSCISTGVITRTWTATDACGNTADCVQTINVEDNYTPIITCPADILNVPNDAGLCSAVVPFTLDESLDPGYNEGWEDAGFVMGTYGGWSSYNSTISSVASGTGGITSKTGSRHGLVVDPIIGNSGTYSRLGAYNSSFCNGYRVSLDVYMDLSDPAVTGDTYGWDLSVASNNQSGTHLQDFIFHTASNASGEILVGASNNSNFTRRNDLLSINHHTITASGWYTFEWVFYDNGGTLSVDLNLLDAGGGWLWTETRTDPANIISTVVGGNRYMWFTFLETASLAIDNATIERNTSVVPDFASGTAFPVGTTTVTVTSTDCCTNDVTCTFDVEVIDTELPTITCPTPLNPYLVNAGSTWVASGLEPDAYGDNCPTADLYYSVDAGGTWISGNVNGYAFPIGTTNVIYKVIDGATNESIPCNFDVIVQGVTVTGTVDYYNAANSPLTNIVTVALDGTPFTDDTDAAGVYTFTDVPLGTYDVLITSDKDVGGINSTDAAQVNFWSVNNSSIQIVRFKAGDVNNNNNIHSTDASQIQQFFLTLGNPGVPFATDWSFWKVGETIGSNPGPSVLPTITVSGAAASITQDFYGLVTGDFNRSFTPGASKSASETLTLGYGDVMEVDNISEFKLPLYAASDMKVGAVSLILDIPSDIIEVQDVYLGNDPNEPVLFNVNGNELLISWHSLSPVSVQKEEALLTLDLSINGSSGADGIKLTLAVNPLNELADDGYVVINNAKLVVDIVKTATLGTGGLSFAEQLTFSNQPNPFNGTTSFVYDLPSNGNVILDIYDIVGNKVKTVVNEAQSAGDHVQKLNSGVLRPGVYTATLRFEKDGNFLSNTIKIISK